VVIRWLTGREAPAAGPGPGKAVLAVEGEADGLPSAKPNGVTAIQADSPTQKT